jgi:4-carboxymuconolactone decarboxylase
MTTLEERATAGLAMRKRVLGEEYVENSLQRSNEFARPLQDFLNENCWGSPGPDLAWSRRLGARSR